MVKLASVCDENVLEANDYVRCYKASAWSLDLQCCGLKDFDGGWRGDLGLRSGRVSSGVFSIGRRGRVRRWAGYLRLE